MSKNCYYQHPETKKCRSSDCTNYGKECPALKYEMISVQDCIQSIPEKKKEVN
jgi:hypothetical protein